MNAHCPESPLLSCRCAGTDAAAAAADVLYSPLIDDYADYGGQGSQPPGLGAASTPIDHGGQPGTALPPWRAASSDLASAEPIPVWQQPDGSSPTAGRGAGQPGAAAPWQQPMQAPTHAMPAAGGPFGVLQSGYPSSRAPVPLAVAVAQQQQGQYQHAPQAMAQHPLVAHQPAPQSGYAAPVRSGTAPGLQEPFFPQSGYPSNTQHSVQQQVAGYGPPQHQYSYGAPQQSGYGGPQQGGWPQAYAGHHGQPGTAAGGYAHTFQAPPAQLGHGLAPIRPPTLQPPQQRPFQPGVPMQAPSPKQQPPPQCAAFGTNHHSAGPPTPAMDAYGVQICL